MGTALITIWLALSMAAPAKREVYRSIHVENDRVIITTTSGRQITPRPEQDQVGIESPRLSPDGKTAGWLVLYEGHTTSYPIPLTLITYSAGVVRRYSADAVFWKWAFLEGGRRLAFADGPLHGSHHPYRYEMWDVVRARRVATYVPKPDPADPEIDVGDPPDWVMALDAARN